MSAPNPAAAPAADAAATLFVTDSNCQADPTKPDHKRTHSHLIKGAVRSFTFTYGERMSLPFAIACKFLKDPSFIVEERSGAGEHDFRRYEPPPAEMDPHVAPKDHKLFKLDPDKVIAKYGELTHEALLVRANMEDGGEKFRKNASKDDLIAFLMKAREKRYAALAAAVKAAASDEENEDEFTPDPDADLEREAA